jgi:hypothetical protein
MLNDAIEEMERENINVGVASAFGALNNAMGILCDVVTPASQVPRDPAPRLFSLWFSCF